MLLYLVFTHHNLLSNKIKNDILAYTKNLLISYYFHKNYSDFMEIELVYHFQDSLKNANIKIKAEAY